MKKKICWITSDSFIDVDKGIIPYIVKCFDLMWYVIITPNNALYKYNSDELKIFAEQNNIKIQIVNQKVKYKDVRALDIMYGGISSVKVMTEHLIYL